MRSIALGSNHCAVFARVQQHLRCMAQHRRSAACEPGVSGIAAASGGIVILLLAILSKMLDEPLLQSWPQTP